MASMPTTTRVSGSRIRDARLGARLTQEGLARAVNTSARNIVRWETEANVPRLKHLAAIAQATGQEVTYFLSADDAEEEDAISRLRRVRAELVLAGRDDLAADLLKLVGAR
jgi:transcriptional regulator with XRE-family HTH domain